MKKSFLQRLLPLTNDINPTMISADDSDEVLAKYAQNGHREAFIGLYNRYLNKVYNRVKSRVPVENVEDVTQEIFIAVIRSLPGFRNEARFNTWLYTIVNRQIAEFYRQRSRHRGDTPTLSLEEMEFGEPSYEHDQLDETVAIQKALNAIPDHYREIVLMRFIDGLSFQEIADARNQTLEAVKSLFRRAVQAIRDEVGEVEL